MKCSSCGTELNAGGLFSGSYSALSTEELKAVNDYLKNKLSPNLNEVISNESLDLIWEKLSESDRFNSFEYCYIIGGFAKEFNINVANLCFFLNQDEIKEKKDLEKIILCDVQIEIYPKLEKSFLNLLHNSGYPDVKFEKKIDFDQLYSQRLN